MSTTIRPLWSWYRLWLEAAPAKEGPAAAEEKGPAEAPVMSGAVWCTC